ncbi:MULTISPECIES: hypothetical protein [unclassified Methylophaga]|jgi:histidine ammonia-lyase|uniref:hypothetical protein n=1 Tax=unclassified Methylophaga TaxID=2629249 RepID=UPI000C8FFE4D|nr:MULTISPECIES: hypothetical protein [unclassified Methylophaga]MAP28402.1 hypothetical protein [Methylophaga sp.]|tara:strand:+ start:785 stop:1060 length:276 start_codon:yes stop_codon:yes gene_type:complete
MKFKTLRRDEVLQDVIKQAGANAEFKLSRVDQKDDHVTRALWAGDKLVIILEKARKVVGYNLFSRSQQKRAKKYSHAFLEEKRILWQRSEQ